MSLFPLDYLPRYGGPGSDVAPPRAPVPSLFDALRARLEQESRPPSLLGALATMFGPLDGPRTSPLDPLTAQSSANFLPAVAPTSPFASILPSTFPTSAPPMGLAPWLTNVGSVRTDVRDNVADFPAPAALVPQRWADAIYQSPPQTNAPNYRWQEQLLPPNSLGASTTTHWPTSWIQAATPSSATWAEPVPWPAPTGSVGDSHQLNAWENPSQEAAWPDPPSADPARLGEHFANFNRYQSGTRDPLNAGTALEARFAPPEVANYPESTRPHEDLAAILDDFVTRARPASDLDVASDADPDAWTPGADYAQRRSGVRPGVRPLSPPEDFRVFFYNQNRKVLRELDPNHPLLTTPQVASPDWVPSRELVTRYQDEVARLKAGRGAPYLEEHHNLPKEQREEFETRGLDIQHYRTYMPRAEHRLRPGGLHTGPNNWNAVWRNFLLKHPDAEASDVFAHLRDMLRLPPW